ncbi:helix-turn-helix transcriptional regulator [Kocuria sp. U4B]
MSAVSHEKLVADDPEAVTDLFAQLGMRFTLDPTSPGFSYREDRAGDEDLTISRVGLGGAFSTWGDTEVFGVTVLHHGSRYEWSTRDEAGTGTRCPLLLRPHHPALILAADLDATNIYLTAHLLQQVADTVYGTEHTPVAFASSYPTTPRLGSYWSGLAHWAADTADSAAFEVPLVRANLTRHLAVAALECFPLTGDRQTRSLSMAAQTRRYRIATQFLDDHAHQPITVEDAARAASTTTSLLTRAFRANHPQGLSPTEYLRRARLAGAHADLLEADPTTGATVAAIASRWGFAHPGRFAAAYRTTYGVPPSITLRR